MELQREKKGKDYALLLLAGGKSSRMGQNKAELMFQGNSFVRNLLIKADKIGLQDKFLSGYMLDMEDVKVVPDVYKDRGPLGGMHACMQAMDNSYCLVLPVDVPQIPGRILEELLKKHKNLSEEEKEKPLLLSHGERIEPLIGIYPVKMKDIIEQCIRDKSAAVFDVLKKTGYLECRIRTEEWQVENINTPETYAMVLKKDKGAPKMEEGITLQRALTLINERIRRIEDVQKVEVGEAGGYILAEDIYATIDNPPFARSPVDGYAAIAADLQTASVEHPVKLKVKGCIYAGDDGESFTIQSGEAYQIMTGAPFPNKADTAVRQEDTDYGESEVLIYKNQRSYDNYCFQGEDYKKGTLLLKKGKKITFAEQGILSGLGYTHVQVYRKPGIRVFTTGSELCEPGKQLASGKIYDSNGMMVAARLKELGIIPLAVKHLDDEEEIVARELRTACQDADVIVTTGGVSVGKKDILHGALELLGAEKVFWRIKLQPGMPTIFSVYKDTLIVSLSGNPFGAMANLELLLRPILDGLTHTEIFQMERKTGIMEGEFPKKSKVQRFVRAKYKEGKVTLPDGIFSSGSIGTLRDCNCLLEIPAGTECVKSGDEVIVWML